MADIRKVTLYRIKPGSDFDDFLKGPLRNYDEFASNDQGYRGYTKFDTAGGAEKTEDQIPWLRFLNSGPSGAQYEFRARNKFPRGMMALSIDRENGPPMYYFAAFGQHGDSYLEKSKITYDFGIKVGMNICDVEKLKRIQTTAHEAISRQTERQASIGAPLDVFGINTEAEFLRTISGAVQDDFKATIESFKGKESIDIKLPKDRDFDWDGLAQLCVRLEEQYNSNRYKDTEFRVYDNLRVESDPIIIGALDQIISEQIERGAFQSMHLAPPEFMDSDEAYFTYQAKEEGRDPEIFEDLNIVDLISTPRRRLANITIDTVKRWQVFRYEPEHGRTYPLWNAYRCLVAEVVYGGRTYILSNAQWKEVSPDLQALVGAYFSQNVMDIDCDTLKVGINIKAGDGKFRESVYNRSVAEKSDALYLFDKAKIKIGSNKYYEVCDLLQDDGKIIHVKRYSSGSASISHLFTQGKFYSHAFSIDAACRAGMVAWIDEDEDDLAKTKDKEKFKALIPASKSDLVEKNFTIVFCILHTDTDFTINDLPFMARYELMNAHRFLTQDRGFCVGVVFRNVVAQ